MSDYNTYEVKDLILDDSFIEWSINGSDEHAAFWEKWIVSFPGNKELAEQAHEILLTLEIKSATELSETEVNQMIFDFKQKHSGYSRTKSLLFNNTLIKIASVLLIAILTGIILYTPTRKKAIAKFDKPAVVSVIRSKINRTPFPTLIHLADGSSVILKPGSSITYPALFKGKTREVYLKGEAFFEVAKNKHKPFLVHSGEMITRVLGTSFTVMAFEKDKEFKVIVNTGKVTVYKEERKQALPNPATDHPKPLVLIPNQRAIYNRANVTFAKEEIKVPLMLSKEVSVKNFTFNEVPLSKVIHKLEEAYGVVIIYDEKSIGGCPLTASMSDQPLYEKLNLICTAINAKFYVNDGHISINGTGCPEPKTTKPNIKL